jgi:hypothetical protein
VDSQQAVTRPCDCALTFQCTPELCVIQDLCTRTKEIALCHVLTIDILISEGSRLTLHWLECDRRGKPHGKHRHRHRLSWKWEGNYLQIFYIFRVFALFSPYSIFYVIFQFSTHKEIRSIACIAGCLNTFKLLKSSIVKISTGNSNYKYRYKFGINKQQYADSVKGSIISI